MGADGEGESATLASMRSVTPPHDSVTSTRPCQMLAPTSPSSCGA